MCQFLPFVQLPDGTRKQNGMPRASRWPGPGLGNTLGPAVADAASSEACSVQPYRSASAKSQERDDHIPRRATGCYIFVNIRFKETIFVEYKSHVVDGARRSRIVI